MKTLKSFINKHYRNPHKNTLETKTIRNKSWHQSQIKKYVPAVILVIAGFFMTLIPSAKALMKDYNFKKHNTDTSSLQDINTNINESSLEKTNTDIDNPKEDQVNQDSSLEKSSLSTNIELKTENITNNSTISNDSSLSVNGKEIKADKNGRINQEITTENSEIKIKGNIKNNSDNNYTDLKISTEVISDDY